MNQDIDKLSPAVVYDVMTFDLKYDGHFMLDTEIRLFAGKRIAGPAFTVYGKYTPNRLSDYEERAVVIDMLSAMSDGVVEVLQPNYAGPLGCWGDFTASLVRKYGCRGAVVDGFTRDVKGLGEMEFPTFCRGTNLINGFGSGWQIDGFQEVVTMPGHLGVPVSVAPGDCVIGDADGVVVVPRDMVDDVTGLGLKRLERERELKAMLDSGQLPQKELKTTIFDW